MSSSVITISQPPSVPSGLRSPPEPPQVRSGSFNNQSTDDLGLFSMSEEDEEEDLDLLEDEEKKERDRGNSFKKLEGPISDRPASGPSYPAKGKGRGKRIPEAYIELQEERVRCTCPFIPDIN